MSIHYRFVEIIDTVSIRGNKLFGDAGSFGESTFPPRPSVLSGAFRSVLWANNGEDARAIQESDFSITSVLPACIDEGGEAAVFLPLPADLLVTDEGGIIRRLQPQALDRSIQHSQVSQLPMIPVLRQNKAAKPENGWLLNSQGIQAYLQGGDLNGLSAPAITRQAELWDKEPRVGIGLGRHTRTVEEGKLFSVEHTVPKQPEHWISAENEQVSQQNSGLLVGISGADALPESGFIRLGGDGRAARFFTPDNALVAKPESPVIANQFKLVLLTPGLFEKGWLPDGLEEQNGEYWLKRDNLTARLACAAVSRSEVISGWDLEKWQPKNAERAAPAGSVYWFDQVEGDSRELNKLVAQGLWSETLDDVMKSRRAEGFNRVLLAAW